MRIFQSWNNEYIISIKEDKRSVLKLKTVIISLKIRKRTFNSSLSSRNLPKTILF